MTLRPPDPPVRPLAVRTSRRGHACRSDVGALLATVALATGCEFFVPPPPDPALDGLLSCDESLALDGLTGADELPVDADAPSGLRLWTRFDDVDLAAVLEIRDDEGPRNLAEFWDPEAEATTTTGSLAAGETARIELVDPVGDGMSGTLALECPGPERCWDLADDNGDGRVDCADPLCARDPECVQGQSVLASRTVACGAVFVAVDAPTLRPIDDQRTLYTTFPLGESLPWEEFWGGAEVRLVGAPVGSTVEVRADVGGLVCPGAERDGTVQCEEPVRLSPGGTVAVPGGVDVFLEPLGAAWSGLEVLVSCPAMR